MGQIQTDTEGTKVFFAFINLSPPLELNVICGNTRSDAVNQICHILLTGLVQLHRRGF